MQNVKQDIREPLMELVYLRNCAVCSNTSITTTIQRSTETAEDVKIEDLFQFPALSKSYTKEPNKDFDPKSQTKDSEFLEVARTSKGLAFWVCL